MHYYLRRLNAVDLRIFRVLRELKSIGKEAHSNCEAGRNCNDFPYFIDEENEARSGEGS